MEGLSDEDLMERFQGGDTQAMEVLFDRHAKGVRSFLARMVRDGALADDLVQSTFLSVVRSADRYQRGLKVVPWLLTIAGNAARDALRRNRHREVSVEDETVEPFFEMAPSDPGARKRIEAAFAELPVQQREAVVLHKLEGLPFDEIARMLDITETAARIRAHRGYERLRGLLGEELVP